MFPDYKEQLLTPKKCGRLMLCYLQATITGAGTFTLNTADTSPGVSLVRNTTGQYTVTGPKGKFIHPVSSYLLLAESLGTRVEPESMSAANGTLTYETATTIGTAVDPATNSVLLITWLVGRL